MLTFLNRLEFGRLVPVLTLVVVVWCCATDVRAQRTWIAPSNGTGVTADIVSMAGDGQYGDFQVPSSVVVARGTFLLSPRVRLIAEIPFAFARGSVPTFAGVGQIDERSISDGLVGNPYAGLEWLHPGHRLVLSVGLAPPLMRNRAPGIQLPARAAYPLRRSAFLPNAVSLPVFARIRQDLVSHVSADAGAGFSYLRFDGADLDYSELTALFDLRFIADYRYLAVELVFVADRTSEYGLEHPRRGLWNFKGGASLTADAGSTDVGIFFFGPGALEEFGFSPLLGLHVGVEL